MDINKKKEREGQRLEGERKKWRKRERITSGKESMKNEAIYFTFTIHFIVQLSF